MGNKQDKVWTIKELVGWGTEYFANKGIESARLTVELLLCRVLNANRIDLYLKYDKPLLEKELRLFKEYVLRRVNREPLQYIVGKAYFLDLELEVELGALIPRPETELLVDRVIRSTGSEFAGKILDIGTGSGCIAIALGKRYPEAEITAIDISENALLTARKNAKRLSVENIGFELLDIFQSMPFIEKFDIIVSNPPYIPLKDYQDLQPEVKLYEPESALTDKGDGLKFYRRYANIFPQILNNGGRFFLEIGHGQYESVRKIFESSGYELELENDMAGMERIVYEINKSKS